MKKYLCFCFRGSWVQHCRRGCARAVRAWERLGRRGRRGPARRRRPLHPRRLRHLRHCCCCCPPQPLLPSCPVRPPGRDRCLRCRCRPTRRKPPGQCPAPSIAAVSTSLLSLSDCYHYFINQCSIKLFIHL